MQRSRARASSNHAAHGQPGEQGATQGLGHHQLLKGAQPDGGDPAQQVVGQGGATSQAALALNLPDGQCRRPTPALK